MEQPSCGLASGACNDSGGDVDLRHESVDGRRRYGFKERLAFDARQTCSYPDAPCRAAKISAVSS